MTTLTLAEPKDLTSTINRIRKGIPAGLFPKFAESLTLSQKDLAGRLGLVARTVDRQRKNRANLSTEATEKILRLERIMNLARLIVPDEKAMAKWMLTPAGPLNNTAPIDLLDTDLGAREVEAFIIGIGHGNFQ